MNIVKTPFLALNALSLFLFCQIATAFEVKEPSFINKVDSSKLDAAGSEISTWVGAIFMIAVGLSAVRPGFHFLSGNREKAMEHIQDVVVGAVVGIVLGGIVFAVMAKVG